ncbi:MAG: PrsW family glutamic-type intramembrane protease, partial [Pseudomonadota bacterium]
MTETVNWAVALAPVLVLAGLFAWLDTFKLMSRWELIGVLLLGVGAGLAAYPLSGRFLDALPLGFSDYSRFVAPWIEEALKLAVVIGLFGFNRVGFKLDAAVQGFAIGAGFAV